MKQPFIMDHEWGVQSFSPVVYSVYLQGTPDKYKEWEHLN